MELLTRYRFVFSSNCKPNASSNLEHAASGSQMSGTEESINDRIVEGRSCTALPEASLFRVFVALIDCSPTVKLLESSGLNVKFMPFGTKSDESYPPKVRLPKAFFKRYGAPAV